MECGLFLFGFYGNIWEKGQLPLDRKQEMFSNTTDVESADTVVSFLSRFCRKDCGDTLTRSTALTLLHNTDKETRSPMSAGLDCCQSTSRGVTVIRVSVGTALPSTNKGKLQ